MPELPEVETIRRGIFPHIKNKKIWKIHRYDEGWKPDLDLTVLIQQEVTQIGRVGKLLTFFFDTRPEILHLHLKMTGQLIYQSRSNRLIGGYSFIDLPDTLPHKHTRISLEFENGDLLFFNDVRKFGSWELVSPQLHQKRVERYGIEPGTAEYTRENFVKVLNNSRTILKSFLLDQTKIAGLGNIYVDEACFHAGVLPQRRVQTLTELEQTKLYHAIKRVITQAIQHRGTSFRDYRDSHGKRGGYARHLAVYGREGELCPSCTIERIHKASCAGRGTHFCPNCQG